MKRALLLLTLAVSITPAAFGQDGALLDRLSVLEQNTSALNAMMARQRSDIADLKSSIDALTSKVDALAKTQGVTLTTSAPNWAGERTFSATALSSSTSSPAFAPMMMMGYGSSACAGGSCGASARRGLFGRRR